MTEKTFIEVNEKAEATSYKASLSPSELRAPDAIEKAYLQGWEDRGALVHLDIDDEVLRKGDFETKPITVKALK